MLPLERPRAIQIALFLRQRYTAVRAHEALPACTAICSRYAADDIKDFARKVDSSRQPPRVHSTTVPGRKLPKEASTQRRHPANDSANYFVYLTAINYTAVQLTFPGKLCTRRGDHRELVVKYERSGILSRCNKFDGWKFARTEQNFQLAAERGRGSPSCE